LGARPAGFDESLALSNFDKAIGIQLTQLIYFIIMAAAVQEFLELPTVTGLQE
jgi:lipid-binding SYLF domain-containing protein